MLLVPLDHDSDICSHIHATTNTLQLSLLKNDDDLTWTRAICLDSVQGLVGWKERRPDQKRAESNRGGGEYHTTRPVNKKEYNKWGFVVCALCGFLVRWWSVCAMEWFVEIWLTDGVREIVVFVLCKSGIWVFLIFLHAHRLTNKQTTTHHSLYHTDWVRATCSADSDKSKIRVANSNNLKFTSSYSRYYRRYFYERKSAMRWNVINQTGICCD